MTVNAGGAPSASGRGPAGKPPGTGPILVTGGGGFLGTHIVKRLLARGEAVRVLGRRPYPRLSDLGADCRQADLTDAAATRRVASGCRAIIHTAGLAGLGCLEAPFRAANVLGTENLLAAALAGGAEKLVYTSSPSVVYDGRDIQGGDESLPYSGRSLSPYAASKAEAERLVLAANGERLATLALRPHLLFGPGDTQILPRLLDRIRRGRLRRIGPGRNLVSVCYVENAAQAHVLALDRLAPGGPAAGRAYFINEPEPVNCWDFINRLAVGSGLPAVEKSLPFPAARLAGWLCETAYRLLGRREDPPLTRFLAGQLAQSHWFRTDGARRDLGWEPEISLEEGLRRTFA